jgi:hypothetical protein
MKLPPLSVLLGYGRAKNSAGFFLVMKLPPLSVLLGYGRAKNSAGFFLVLGLAARTGLADGMGGSGGDGCGSYRT